MQKITPCHILYYWYPYNEYLRWDHWNTMYDFAYNNQDKLYGRTRLITSIRTIQNYIRCKVSLCEEITWHESKLVVGTKKIKLN